MSKDDDKVLPTGRLTGRTSAMLDSAVARSRAGEKVCIVCVDADRAAALQAMLPPDVKIEFQFPTAEQIAAARKALALSGDSFREVMQRFARDVRSNGGHARTWTVKKEDIN